jgi:hypothetical protein
LAKGRALDHLGFAVPDLDATATDIKGKGVQLQQEPRAITRPSSAVSFIGGPDGVRPYRARRASQTAS